MPAGTDSFIFVAAPAGNRDKTYAEALARHSHGRDGPLSRLPGINETGPGVMTDSLLKKGPSSRAGSNLDNDDEDSSAEDFADARKSVSERGTASNLISSLGDDATRDPEGDVQSLQRMVEHLRLENQQLKQRPANTRSFQPTSNPVMKSAESSLTASAPESSAELIRYRARVQELELQSRRDRQRISDLDRSVHDATDKSAKADEALTQAMQALAGRERELEGVNRRLKETSEKYEVLEAKRLRLVDKVREKARVAAAAVAADKVGGGEAIVPRAVAGGVDAGDNRETQKMRD